MSVHGTLVACFSCCCFHHVSPIRAGPAARLVHHTLEIQRGLWKMLISWSVADLFDKLYGILLLLVHAIGVFMWTGVKVLDCCNSVDAISPAGPWMADAECAQGSTGLMNWKLSATILGNLIGGLGVQHPEGAGALNRIPGEWSQLEAARAQGKC